MKSGLENLLVFSDSILSIELQRKTSWIVWGKGKLQSTQGKKQRGQW